MATGCVATWSRGSLICALTSSDGHVIVNALHAGSYYAAQQLDKSVKGAGKEITFTWWRAQTIENRKFYRNQSDVLWPSEIPDDGAVAAYVKTLSDAGYPPEK